MTLQEAVPSNPNVLFVTLVQSVEDNNYAVMTVLMPRMTQLYSRLSEKELGIEPEENPDGLFQTNVYVANEGEQGLEIDMTELLAVRRYYFGRAAVNSHDTIAKQLESEEFDYINDPFYQQVQIEKLQMDLDNFDINSLDVEGE